MILTQQKKRTILYKIAQQLQANKILVLKEILNFKTLLYYFIFCKLLFNDNNSTNLII